MNVGEVTGRLLGTATTVRLRWREGRITDLSAASVSPAPSEPQVCLAPPLFDLQINGYAGVDFQQDHLTTDQLLTAVRGLRRDGCTRFLLTLITDEWTRLTARFQHLAGVRREHPELAAAIAGWHIEGPFLSAAPGYAGAHDPAWMLDPTDAHVDELRALAGGLPLLLTMAPERHGALPVIQRARELGIFVQLGHTNASAAVLREAAGDCAYFTHLGNACPQQLDRHDNILWRVLDLEGLGVSLISDGVHVAPELFRLIHRVKGNRIYYTTDAMSAAGAPPGSYRIGRVEVVVGADGIVRQPGRSNFAGSACTPIDGVWRAAAMLGESWESAWPRLSAIPAQSIGLTHTIAMGQPADFCVLTSDPNHPQAPPRVQTCVGGALECGDLSPLFGRGDLSPRSPTR